MRHVKGENKCIEDFGGETLKGRDHLEGLGVYRIIILKRTLMK
jgi:hypothetical protein